MAYYPKSVYYPSSNANNQAPQPQQPQQQQRFAPQEEQLNRYQQAQLRAQQAQLQYEQAQRDLQSLQLDYERQLAVKQQYQQQPPQQSFVAPQRQYAAQQPAAAQQQQQYQAPQQSSGPVYKPSEYIPVGGYYAAQPNIRRAPSLADVATAIQNEQAASIAQFGQQGVYSEQQYNPYSNYRQNVAQSPLRSERSQRGGPSIYANDELRGSQQVVPSGSNAWLGAQSGAQRVLTFDSNNNAPQGGRSVKFAPQEYTNANNYNRAYANKGAPPQSAYFSIPNDLVLVGSNTDRAYQNNYSSRPATPTKLKPEVAREIYAALSSENVRTAVERDVLPSVIALQKQNQYNGTPVNGAAFRLPSEAGALKFSEYHCESLNGNRLNAF